MRPGWCPTLLVLVVSACNATPSAVPETASPLMTAEALLIGGNECRSDRDCATRVCVLERCLGVLTCAAWPDRVRATQSLRDVLGDAVIRLELLRHARAVLDDADGDPVVRGRAALVLGELPRGDVSARLVEALDDPAEPVRFFAAAALHRLGDPIGTTALQTWSTHGSEAIRQMARAFLEGAAL